MTTPTVELSSFVYGRRTVALDDPAECFHEASRLYPDISPERLPTIIQLEHNPKLGETIARAGRTHESRAGFDLPQTRLGLALLRDVLVRRRSRIPADRRALRRVHLGAMLGAAYQSVGGRRPVPSAGALYPLELYVLAIHVREVESGVYHYDPFRHRLERLGALELGDMESALVDPCLAAGAAALFVVTGVFWRSRFKYGQRGYRFTLIEAGHVVQNAVLAAAALGVPALPLGGFYDTMLDGLVGVDGLEESSVHALVVGGSA